MNIEIWSDFMCPFCYIGKRRFENALERFGSKEKVEIIYRSFELDPAAKRDVDYNVNDMLASKYGMSREEAKAMNDNVTKQAQDVGLTYHLDKMVLTNSFDAHRLTHLAARYGKMKEMAERLFKAHFTESKHIGNHQTLAALAAEIGLNPSEAADMLAGKQFTNEVRAEQQEAAKLGIRGVPFFVINRKYAISGAQPSEVFLNALQQAWEEERETNLPSSNSEADEACADGMCATPSSPKQ